MTTLVVIDDYRGHHFLAPCSAFPSGAEKVRFISLSSPSRQKGTTGWLVLDPGEPLFSVFSAVFFRFLLPFPRTL